MAGIHTVNLNGSNNHQILNTGNNPSWQAVEAASTTSSTTPGAPDTGYGRPAPTKAGGVLVVFIIVIIVSFFIIKKVSRLLE